ncbi:DUF3465 domain-containing protein [bacterium]|nr:DUF3465 domain-containing protein [bacterium]
MAIALAVLAWQEWGGGGAPASRGPVADQASAPAKPAADDGAARVARAFADRRSDLQVEVAGRVRRVLRDDDEGSRHQRFILALSDGHTVLVAHNIDLAERVPLAEGDGVRVHGEYEWNEQGGVIHWTHRDPGGRHIDGWIESGGRRYW